MERLQRVMAARGAGSRRRAEELIKAGRVSVDGAVVTELGTKVDPIASQIRVDGVLLRRQAPRYLILNKPRGYITTVSDERDRRTVMDLVAVPERVYPVGRLDRQTEGLLVLTNDGDVANRIMHPRYELAKEYHVLTLSRPSERTLQRLRDGVTIDGKRVVPQECRVLRETPEGLILKVVIHEGMYHIVRRMMDEVGIPVARLRRVRVGPLTLGNLPAGGWRDLSEAELANLFQALRLDRTGDEPVRGWRSRRREGVTTPDVPADVSASANKATRRPRSTPPNATNDRREPAGDERQARPARRPDRPTRPVRGKQSSAPGAPTNPVDQPMPKGQSAPELPHAPRSKQPDRTPAGDQPEGVQRPARSRTGRRGTKPPTTTPPTRRKRADDTSGKERPPRDRRGNRSFDRSSGDRPRKRGR